MLIYNSVLRERWFPDQLNSWNMLTFPEIQEQNVENFVNSFNV